MDAIWGALDVIWSILRRWSGGRILYYSCSTASAKLSIVVWVWQRDLSQKLALLGEAIAGRRLHALAIESRIKMSSWLTSQVHFQTKWPLFAAWFSTLRSKVVYRVSLSLGQKKPSLIWDNSISQASILISFDTKIFFHKLLTLTEPAELWTLGIVFLFLVYFKNNYKEIKT